MSSLLQHSEFDTLPYLPASPDENLSHIGCRCFQLFGKLRGRQPIAIPPVDCPLTPGSQFTDTVADGVDRERLLFLVRLEVAIQE